MDMGIAGKRALVAGGSSGIGRAVADALAAEGAVMGVVARDAARLSRVAGEVAAASGASVVPIAADYMTAEGRARVLAAFPDPDILVMSSTPPDFTPDFRAIQRAEWEHSFATGAIGPIELIQAVLDGMCARGYGRIVSIATLAAKFPIERRLLSGPARSALANYIAAVSRRVARKGVAINSILPGLVRTEPMIARAQTEAEAAGITLDERLAQVAKEWRLPVGRLGVPEEIAAAALFLCSRQAGFTVGQSFVLDGGAGVSLM